MIKVGIIGAGNNAAGHARYYHKSLRAEVSGIFDPAQETANAVAKEVESVAMERVDDVIESADVVVVASPNRFHREQVIACCKAGKPVYCEKPIGLTGDDAQAMADAARDAGVSSAVGFSVRLHPTIQTMLRLRDEGAFGDLVSVSSRRMMAMSPDEFTGWRGNSAETGGLLLEINIHEIDWMMMLGGPVRSVFARSRTTITSGPKANDHIWVQLDFENEACGTHDGSWDSPVSSFQRSIYGTAGGASTDRWGVSLDTTFAGETAEKVDLDNPLDLRAHFLDAVELGTPSTCDLAWGVQVMRTCDAIFASAESGMPVKVKA